MGADPLTMQLSLVIPAYNEERYLDACLKAIESVRQEFLEVLVVDNNSTDGTRMVVAQYPWATLITEPRQGVVFARAAGLERARGEGVAFLDADTRMPKNWPQKVKRHFADEKVVCLSGPYVFYDCGLLLAIITELFFVFFAYPTYLVSRYMAILGNTVVRKSAMEKIGGFDLSVEFYGDDTNLSKRLSAVGKARFSLGLRMYTSARRLQREGLFRTMYNYAMAYNAEAFLGRHWSKKYTEVR